MEKQRKTPPARSIFSSLLTRTRVLTLLLLALIGAGSSPVHAAPIPNPSSAVPGMVEEARRHIFNGDFDAARELLEQAVILAPNHSNANFFLAMVRLIGITQLRDFHYFLDCVGVSEEGRDPLCWTADFTRSLDGEVELPLVLEFNQLVEILRGPILREIRASNIILKRIKGINLTLSGKETGFETVTIDYGDVLLIQATLHSIEFFIETLNAHNFQFSYGRAVKLHDEGILSIQQLLELDPAFLSISDPRDVRNSKRTLTSAIDTYMAASTLIRRRPAGKDSLFTLDPEMIQAESKARHVLTQIKKSMTDVVRLEARASWRFTSKNYFSGKLDLRSLVPEFEWDSYVPETVPDPTFGGTLVGVHPAKTEAFFIDTFPFVEFEPEPEQLP